MGVKEHKTKLTNMFSDSKTPSIEIGKLIKAMGIDRPVKKLPISKTKNVLNIKL